jgi:hypothetical protein
MLVSYFKLKTPQTEDINPTSDWPMTVLTYYTIHKACRNNITWQSRDKNKLVPYLHEPPVLPIKNYNFKHEFNSLEF